MTVPLFKDFHRETSDVLTKNVCGSHRWRIDCKMKSHKDQIAVHPSASNDGMSFVVEAKSSLFPNVSAKGTFTERAVKKLTMSLNLDQGRKIDLSTDLKRFSFTHQRLGKGWSITDTVTYKAVETQTSFRINDSCSVGFGVKIPVSSLSLLWTNPFGTEASPKTTPTTGGRSKAEVTPTPSILPPSTSSKISSISYEFGARVARGLVVSNVAVVDNFSKCVVGLYVPTRIYKTGRPIALGTEATFFLSGRLPTIAAAFETSCFFFKGNTLKARLDENQRVSLCYVLKQRGSSAAFTLSDKGKIGVNFSFEETSASSASVSSSSSSSVVDGPSKKSSSSSTNSRSNGNHFSDPVKL